MVHSKRPKPTERYCPKALTIGDMAFRCLGDKCTCFVYIPMRKYRVGGKESHEWKGCMYVLVTLAKFSKISGIPIDDILSLNR